MDADGRGRVIFQLADANLNQGLAYLSLSRGQYFFLTLASGRFANVDYGTE